jgi:YD repeat-containing protein
MGRLKEQAIGDGAGHSLTASYEYDALGRVWRVTDPSGNQAFTEYDAAGRQAKVTDSENSVVAYTRNAAGQLTKTIRKDHKPGAGTAADSDYLWYVVAFAYDSEGRISSVTDQGEDVPDQNGQYDGIGEGKNGLDDATEDYLVTQTHYYDDAFQTSVVTTDPLTHHNKVVYDGLGRQRWLKDGGSGTLGQETYARETRFDYDATGRQTALVSGGPDGVVGQGSDDQTTTYTYNSHGLVASVQYPDASPNTVSYTYYVSNDAATTVTDQKNMVTSYTYKAVADGQNYRLESRQYVSSGTPDGGDRDVITTVNGQGQVLTVVTKDTAGGTQTSKVTRQYKFCGAADRGRQRRQPDRRVRLRLLRQGQQALLAAHRHVGRLRRVLQLRRPQPRQDLQQQHRRHGHHDRYLHLPGRASGHQGVPAERFDENGPPDVLVLVREQLRPLRPAGGIPRRPQPHRHPGGRDEDQLRL